MSSSRDQKHRQKKIYYQKTNNNKLLRAQDDSVNEMMCQVLKQ